MGIRCKICKYVVSGKEGLHLIKECPNCGNKDKDKFERVPDKIDEEQKKMEREWLESHEEDEK